MNWKTIIPTACGAFAAITSAQAMTYVVYKNADDGSTGTLRWAIQQSNAMGGTNTILVKPAYRGWVIMLLSPLPPIKGPATVTALGAENVEYKLPPSAETQVTQPVRAGLVRKACGSSRRLELHKSEHRHVLPGANRQYVWTERAFLDVSGPSGRGFRQRRYQRL